MPHVQYAHWQARADRFRPERRLPKIFEKKTSRRTEEVISIAQWGPIMRDGTRRQISRFAVTVIAVGT